MTHASDPRQIAGQCLCGAVMVTAVLEKPIMRACHCDMCRRHTSSMFMSIANDPFSVQVNGPASSFQSSDWAERGFCERCGSTLWYGTRHDGAKYLAAGLFENAAGAEMKIEFYADNCPHGYALAGDQRKLNTKETIALFESDEG